MKKTVFAVLVVMLAMAMVFFDNVMAQEKPADIRGEWKVISVRCLDILAEKDGVKRIFQYKPPSSPLGMSPLQILGSCLNVKPGWIIFVESEEKYSFFPPSASVPAAIVPAKPKPQSKVPAKK